MNGSDSAQEMRDRLDEIIAGRSDLQPYNRNKLGLFAIQNYLNLPEIASEAETTITDGPDDRKIDLVYIDENNGHVIVVQNYVSNRKPIPTEAPSSKASDLNTAISWLLGAHAESLPKFLQSHRDEILRLLKEQKVERISFWFVHNLPESENVSKELERVKDTATKYLRDLNATAHVEVLEIGLRRGIEFYESIQTPILVDETIDLGHVTGWEDKQDGWRAFVTKIGLSTLRSWFDKYGKNMFSANIRDYLGSRKTDQNINNGIKDTATNEPERFFVYNNGLTALVHSFECTPQEDGTYRLKITGLSVINGAQTTGSVGNMATAPDPAANVLIRFIESSDQNLVQDIVRYNNSQNKLDVTDFRTNDRVQRRLREEFSNSSTKVYYYSRRGGSTDAIPRNRLSLSSAEAGQLIASFHGDPGVAYHQKSALWEEDRLYAKYFNDSTTASHIIFLYSLREIIDEKKRELRESIGSSTGLSKVDQQVYEFLSTRGSVHLFMTAIGEAMESVLSDAVPDKFQLKFTNTVSFEDMKKHWSSVLGTLYPLTMPLKKGLDKGLRDENTIAEVTSTFASLIASVANANQPTYSAFKDKLQ